MAALTITAILCALSVTMPSPSKFAVAAIVSFVLASVSAGIIRFYVLTESQDLVQLAVAIAPVLISGCLLSVCPAIAGIGLIMNVFFLVLLAPSNPQAYNPLTFYSECMFVAFALAVVFLASPWCGRCLRSTGDARSSGRHGKRSRHPSPARSTACQRSNLVWLPGSDYVASVAGTRQRRREVLKGLLSTNDLSLAAASAHLHLEQSSDDPVIRSRIGPLQRSGNSRRLCAGARSILRKMHVGQAEARDALLGAATDLWSAGLVLGREKRRIRHFCDHGSVRKGDVRWSLHRRREDDLRSRCSAMLQPAWLLSRYLLPRAMAG